MKYLTGEMVLPSKDEMYELLWADQKMRQEKLGMYCGHIVICKIITN